MELSRSSAVRRQRRCFQLSVCHGFGAVVTNQPILEGDRFGVLATALDQANINSSRMLGIDLSARCHTYEPVTRRPLRRHLAPVFINEALLYAAIIELNFRKIQIKELPILGNAGVDFDLHLRGQSR